MLHRLALTITRKQPYADWANRESAKWPDSVAYSDELPRTIYLVPAIDSASVPELLEEFWPDIFEEELEGWSVDEATWPEPRTRELFDLWFAAELTDTVVDLAPDEPLTEADVELDSVNYALVHCAWCDLELEPDEGRRVGFKVADRERLAHREGLVLSLLIDDERVLTGIVTPRDSDAAAAGDDLLFRACASRCEKLIRKEVPRALRRLLALAGTEASTRGLAEVRRRLSGAKGGEMEDKRSPGLKVGVAWYLEAEWDRLRELAADREMLEETYAEWRRVYEDGVHKLAASGLATEPVEVRVAELQAWCAARRRPFDANARAEFVSEIMAGRSEQTPPSSPRFPRFWRD